MVRQLWALLRHQASLIRLGTQLRNRIHAVAADHGYDRAASYWTGPGRGWLADLDLPLVSAVFHVSSRRDSRRHAASRVIRRNTNRRHMSGDHHRRVADTATLLLTAMDGILGTHNMADSVRDHQRGARRPPPPHRSQTGQREPIVCIKG